ncbi:CDP-alcohol phosphatidyltransferase family protein [Shimia sp.]|uniref:CDP-alcohol phosphatidyltransferase family protein n=1 Tax=Shimia sp. TaxID=1954381 RepID=UPI00329719E3
MSYSLHQLIDANRATAEEEKTSNWSVFLLYRLPGNVLAWAFLKTPATPTNVTFLALLVVLLIPFSAGLLPLAIAGVATCVLALLFQALDCADGSMARVSGMGSEAGGRYDFLVDMFQWGVLYAAMGLLADRAADSGVFWTMLGFMAGWLRLFARVCNDRAPKNVPTSQSTPGWAMWFLNGLSGLIPFLFLSGPYMHLAVIAVLIYSIGDVFDALTRVIE